MGSHRGLRRLRVQQVALGGLRAGELPDGLVEGEPSRRVHGRPADEREEQQGPSAAVPADLPDDGHPGPAARRQLLRAGLRSRR